MVVTLFFILYHTTLQAQVTIGLTTQPAKAALLQLKTQSPDTENVTTDVGGLLLPRVKLVDRTTMEPFIANDLEFQNNVNKIKDRHVGLIVYNLSSSMDDATVTKRFLSGVYVWDGSQWQLAGDNKQQTHWFYPPAFNLPLPAVDTSTDPVRSYDLYAEYQRQFVKNTTNNPTFVHSSNGISTNVPSPIDGRVYGRNELDYVITHYDATIIYDVTVNNQGVLSYRVKDNDPSGESFTNLIFVVKE